MLINPNIDDLVRGSIDMHIHFAPDALMTFRMDALETAKLAHQMGMRAIVLKAHTYSSAPLANMVGKLVPEIKVFGSICLDYEVGGLNFHALKAAAKLGARVVWMPTHSSNNERSKPAGFDLEGEGFSILNSKNKLVPEIDKILSLIKEYKMVLASGHISPAEVFALVEKALAKGISRLVITHPLTSEFLKQGLTLEDQRRLAKMGAFIEHTYVGYLPNDLRHDPQILVEAIRTIGAEQTIISTDLGQYDNPPPSEGMRMFIGLLLRNGVTEHEIELMAKLNPAKLLDLD
jgi:hypothetical protein